MTQKNKASKGKARSIRKAAPSRPPSVGLVRASRDGDQFHYHWAARQSLRLLGERDLMAVTIEGPSTMEATNDVITAGEEMIDVGFYYGSEGRDQARLVQYVQLKHSTLQSQEAWTASGLAKTLKEFARRYTELVRRYPEHDVTRRFRFEFATNRPIDPKVQESIADLAAGAKPRHPKENNSLRRYSGLTATRVKLFFRLFTATGGVGDLWAQRHSLAQDLAQYLAGADSEARLELKELVARKATSEFATNPSIRRHDVLRALKTNESDLSPAPCLLRDPADTLPREQEQEIIGTLLTAPVPLVIHADGGVGKSILATRLAASMPSGSVAVLYDCFGDGLYRSVLGRRHRHCDALVQIANELALRGLCYPLIPMPHADIKAYMRAFIGRLSQAIGSLREKTPTATLCLIVDAADNAEMAAAEQQEPGSFVRDLIRAPMPSGVNLAFTCRSHRRGLLHAPPGIREVSLRPFSPTESFQHLKTRYPDASDTQASEFAYLTSSNPRVQALALEQSTSLSDMLRSLGPEPRTVEHTIGELLEAALARIKDSQSGDEAASVERICRGIAVFRPLVPVSVLAKLAAVPEGAVRSFALDLGRPIVLKGDSVHFQDEPTETWFRERYFPEPAELAAFVERLRPLTRTSAYAAAALPQLLLRLERFDELVRLALSDENLPSSNLLEQRDVKMQRLRFALKACLQSANYVAAGKLALKTGGECAGERRQNQLIESHTDIAGLFMSADRIETLLAHRTFGDKWMGSHYAYEAGLLSAREEHHAEASSRLRMATDWLYAWVRQPEARQHHEQVTDEDFAEIAIATLRLHGPRKAAQFLAGWQPQYLVFRAAELMGRRLIDISRYDLLDSLAENCDDDPWILLGLCIEAGAMGHLLPAAPLSNVLKILQHRGEALQDPSYNEAWQLLDAVCCAIEQALKALPHEKEAWADVIRQYLPANPPKLVSLHHGHPHRARVWRAYALEAALRGERATVDNITPKTIRDHKQHGARTYDDKLFLSEASGLLPWMILAAECICGRPPTDLMVAIQDTLRETDRAEHLVYQSHTATRPYIAIEWIRIIRSAPNVRDHDLDALREWISTHSPSLPINEAIMLCRIAARRSDLGSLAIELGSQAYAALDGSRDSAESVTESLLKLTCAILAVSQDEARAYFERAVEVSSRIGDENLERWNALLDLAVAASERDRPRPKCAYRLSRIAELTYKYVERDKYFPWVSTVEALVGLCPTSGVAVLSRWRDRRFGRSERLLQIAVQSLVASRVVPERTPVALAGVDADWSRARNLERALAAESNSAARKRLAAVAYRYIRLTESTPATWTTLQELQERYSLDFPDIEQLAFASNADDSQRGGILSPTARTHANTTDHRTTMDWNESFRSIDVCDSASLFMLYTSTQQFEDRKQFFSQAVARVAPGRESDFVRAVAAWPDLTFFVLEELLQAFPSPFPQQLALRNAMRETILDVCRGDPRLAQRLRWDESGTFATLRVGELVSAPDIATAMLGGIGARSEHLNSDELFQALKPLSVLLLPVQAEEVLEFGLGLLEGLLEPEDGDGEWRAELQPLGTPIDALAGYIWAGLGSAIASERWQYAHVVRTIAELGWTELLQAVIAMAGVDRHAFSDQRLLFYSWHARQWLLIGLARGAIDNPDEVALSLPLLQQCLATRHVIVRRLASQALQTLVDAGRVNISTIGSLAVNRPTGTHAGPGNIRATDDGSEEEVRDDRYHFEPDIGPYWFEPLGRAFSLDRRSVTRLARAAMRHMLGWSGGFGTNDERLSRGFFSEGENGHRHGTLPRADSILTYNSYHAMMFVAADLLAERSVRQEAGCISNEFEEWLSRFTSTRSDGFWLSDWRSPNPFPGVISYQDNWRWSVTANYLDQQLTTADSRRVVWGDWRIRTMSGGYEVVEIRSAIVSRTGAAALVAALQTTVKLEAFTLPYATEREETRNDDADGSYAHDSENLARDIDAYDHFDDVYDDEEGVDTGSLKLHGWLSCNYKETHLDDYDPWGEGVRCPRAAPSAGAVSRLKLTPRDGGIVWRSLLGGDLRSELWSVTHGHGRSRDIVSGERCSVDASLLRALLEAYPNYLLIVSVSIRRDPSYDDHSDGVARTYSSPYLRYYLIGVDGVATPL